MPKKMILPIAFIIVTLFFVVKGFIGKYQDDHTQENQSQVDTLKTAQEKKEYDLKLQTCIKQQNDYKDSLEAKDELYSIENGKEIDNSFKLLSAECKMMIIRSDKESDVQTANQ